MHVMQRTLTSTVVSQSGIRKWIRNLISNCNYLDGCRECACVFLSIKGQINRKYQFCISLRSHYDYTDSHYSNRDDHLPRVKNWYKPSRLVVRIIVMPFFLDDSYQKQNICLRFQRILIECHAIDTLYYHIRSQCHRDRENFFLMKSIFREDKCHRTHSDRDLCLCVRRTRFVWSMKNSRTYLLNWFESNWMIYM